MPDRIFCGSGQLARRLARISNIANAKKRIEAMKIHIAALAFAFVLSGAAQAQMAKPAESKPTIVLVHGAFADSSSWNASWEN